MKKTMKISLRNHAMNDQNKQGHGVSRAGYVKGEKIQTFVEFADRIQDRKPFYWRHKFMAAGFIEHWSVIMILNSIKYGVLWAANKEVDLCTNKIKGFGIP